MTKQIISIFAAVILLINPARTIWAQNQTNSTVNADVYEKIEMLVTEGDKIREIEVRVRFNNDSLEIESKATGRRSTR